jgi:hypothetical protein
VRRFTMAKIHEEDTQPSRLHPDTNLKKSVILKGDFAEGERTLPPEPVGPDFARGLRTMPVSKSIGAASILRRPHRSLAISPVANTAVCLKMMRNKRHRRRLRVAKTQTFDAREVPGVLHKTYNKGL